MYKNNIPYNILDIIINEFTLQRTIKVTLLKKIIHKINYIVILHNYFNFLLKNLFIKKLATNGQITIKAINCGETFLSATVFRVTLLFVSKICTLLVNESMSRFIFCTAFEISCDISISLGKRSLE